MHSRQLEPVLTDFITTVSEHLRAEVVAGAEVPFELGAHSARGGGGQPLYCYHALTREFIAERDAAIRRLSGYAETARLLDDFDGLDRYLASTGADVVRVKGRERGRLALTALIEEVFDEQTDFEVRTERLTAAVRRLHDTASAQVNETVLVATLHGVAIASEELPLTKGLTIAKRGAIAGLPDTTSVAPAQRQGGEHLLVLHRMQEEDARAAIRRGRDVLRDLLTALRLFGDGRIALGGVAWAQVGGGPWASLALGVVGRAHGTLAVSAEQEDELRAFCNLVSRRAPHGNDLAWALERFELGCERESPLQGLSDHLLALRALLEPEGYWSGMLPGRLAALCAMPPDRAALAERAAAALALERGAVEGTARLDASSKALAEEVATHLKALLRDVICGHLAPDLAGFADELLADAPDGAEPHEGEGPGVASAGTPPEDSPLRDEGPLAEQESLGVE
ncbi:MAG TPA: hypothetical protein VH115_04155 [Solirubrobacteraceae bacterium]|nr:hypothetical protein [Solirubrobacteraceae bacterium]